MLARNVHMVCAYWGLVLIALHLGLHWSMMLGMAGSYSNGYLGQLETGGDEMSGEVSREDFIAVSDAENYVVSIDSKGVLAFSGNTIEKKGRPKAHIIEVLTEAVTADYLSYLKEKEISYIFAGKENLDCKLILDKLQRLFLIDRLMIAGGGFTNWSFAQENLIDELSIVAAPVADGNTRSVSIFEKADFLPNRPPVAFKLKKVEILKENVIWVRYGMKL